MGDTPARQRVFFFYGGERCQGETKELEEERSEGEGEGE